MYVCEIGMVGYEDGGINRVNLRRELGKGVWVEGMGCGNELKG